MKKIVYLLLVLSVSFCAHGQTVKRALFLGNSYTQVNNLPQLIAQVAASAGDSLVVDSNTPGGYTLQGHSANPTSQSKIMQGNWDYVVLQEQSQLPSFPINQVMTDVFPYAKLLDSLVNVSNSCTETMFYMTWGRKNGDASNCGWWPPVCTYEGMDSLLRLRYRMMADSNHAVVSPIGVVWNYIRQNFPAIELYQADQSHPSEAGSYAAACCFYTAIYLKNPMLIAYDYSLSEADADNIRQVVEGVVYDHLTYWNLGKYNPVSDFIHVISNDSQVVFTNLSHNASDYAWDFGDGHHSTSENPVHSYDTIGSYDVSLIASHCNYSDTITKVITITTTDIDGTFQPNSLKVYPNPMINRLNIDLNNETIKEVKVFDALGQIFSPGYTTTVKKLQLDFSGLSSGLYYVFITTDMHVFTYKIIKV